MPCPRESDKPRSPTKCRLICCQSPVLDVFGVVVCYSGTFRFYRGVIYTISAPNSIPSLPRPAVCVSDFPKSGLDLLKDACSVQDRRTRGG